MADCEKFRICDIAIKNEALQIWKQWTKEYFRGLLAITNRHPLGNIADVSNCAHTHVIHRWLSYSSRTFVVDLLVFGALSVFLTGKKICTSHFFICFQSYCINSPPKKAKLEIFGEFFYINFNFF